MVVLVGEVGGGKSSLLSALSGELTPFEGCCETETGAKIGYVPQTPWVMSGTLRDNILRGQPWDARHYQQVGSYGFFLCSVKLKWLLFN